MTSILKVDNLQNASGTSALSINSDGVVTPSVKHAFYMYKSNTQAIAHATGYNVIQFNASRINEGNGVTLGTNARYTVPSGANGIYVLHCHGRLESATDGNATIQMRLNGTPIATTFYYNEYYDGMTVPMLRNLAVGDYVDVCMSNSTGSSMNVGTTDSGDTLYFFGYRLG